MSIYSSVSHRSLGLIRCVLKRSFSNNTCSIYTSKVFIELISPFLALQGGIVQGLPAAARLLEQDWKDVEGSGPEVVQVQKAPSRQSRVGSADHGRRLVKFRPIVMLQDVPCSMCFPKSQLTYSRKCIVADCIRKSTSIRFAENNSYLVLRPFSSRFLFSIAKKT